MEVVTASNGVGVYASVYVCVCLCAVSVNYTVEKHMVSLLQSLIGREVVKGVKGRPCL